MHKIASNVDKQKGETVRSIYEYMMENKENSHTK